MSKKCKSCETIKDLSEFRKHRGQCRPCEQEKNKIYRKSKPGVVNDIYSKQQGKSRARGHHHPTYTHQELKDWLYAQEKFHILYDNWKRLDHQKDYKPSVDRKDDRLGYTMANIQLMTWGENNAKGYRDRRKYDIITHYEKKKHKNNR